MRAPVAALVLAVGLAVGYPATPASADAVRQARLGNNVEGSTPITSGPRAGQVAVLDGYDIRALTVAGARPAPAQAMFDVRSVHWAGFPSGFAYLAPEKSFVFGDQGDHDVLTVTDTAGTVLGSRAVTYRPNSPTPIASAEGFAYLNRDAAFPDTVARLVFDSDFAPYIEVLTRSGVVQRDIALAGLPAGSYPVGLAYVESGGFLVSAADSIWRVSLDGVVTSGPTVVAGTGDLEALTVMPGGRVYTADYAGAVLLGFDRVLTRIPANDRPFQIGVGLSRSFNGFWDPVTGGWILLGIDRDGTSNDVAAVTPSLSSMQVLFHPAGPEYDWRGLSPGPGSSIALCPQSVRSVNEYARSGAATGVVDFSAVSGVPVRACRSLAYLPSLDAYALVLAGRANARTVFVVSRSGTLLRTISVPVDYVATVSTSPGDPDVLLVGGYSGRHYAVVSYDATSGTHLSTATPASDSLASPYAYLAGPDGSYALLDWIDSEIAVLRS